MRQWLGLFDSNNTLKMIAAAAILTMAACVTPKAAEAATCTLIKPCPKLSGSPNPGQTFFSFILDPSVQDKTPNDSEGFFPNAISNVEYRVFSPNCDTLPEDFSTCHQTDSLFFSSGVLKSSSLVSDYDGSIQVKYEAIFAQDPTFRLSFSTISNDPHSLPTPDQSITVSVAGLGRPEASQPIRPIPLYSSPDVTPDVPENPTNVPDNPLSILLGTGMLGSIVFLKRMKRLS